ncbi:MAG: hypothetical protein EOO03_17470 [Chitinophagaceae bacterium]|nr:MAG: hypothetical protein EOO03_17470 [Chitinophagaceae bacterium]
MRSISLTSSSITQKIYRFANIEVDFLYFCIYSTFYLGNTLTEIAGEKAGIIKAGVPVVIGETTPETKVAFLTTSNRLDSEIIFAEKLDLPEIPSDLNGLYQHENKRTVLAAIQTLKKLNLVSVSEDDIYAGFSHVVETTGLLGRWQQLGVNPLVIADTAHNAHGLARVVAQIERQIYQKLHFVLGVVTDKDLSTILPLLPKNAQYYFCKPEGQRGLNAEILMNEAVKFGLSGSWHASVTDAFMAARENASAMDMIYIGGSTFVVAEIL